MSGRDAAWSGDPAAEPEALAAGETALIYGGTWAGPTLVRGKGCRVWDDTGKEYIDCGSQAWTLNTGHCNKEVIDAAFRQARRLAHVRGGHNTPSRLLLARKLSEIAPGRLKKVGFGIGGSLSMESAFKLAMVNRPEAEVFITLYNAWHGASLATMAASWVPTQTKGSFGPGRKFQPFMGKFLRVPNPYCYRCYFDRQYPDCDFLCARMLELKITKEADGPVAGFALEPVQGNGGQIPAPVEYLRKVREICDKYGVLLIYDEIQTAFGRMGKMFAAEFYGVHPDIMALAKAMANGFAIGGIIADERLKLFEPTGEDVYTFGNSPMAQAAALANIDYIEKHKLCERAAEMGAYFTRHLRELQKEFPEIGDIRGPGLHIGVELVRNPISKEPAGQETHDLYNEALKRGVIFGLGGAVPNVVKIKPPLVITTKEADRILEVFSGCLRAVFRK